MSERAAAHRLERGADFVTFEEPLDVARVLRDQRNALDVVVVDCLTLWLSNHLLRDREPPVDELLDVAAVPPLVTILVTNEVGCGIVPENALARRFRDLAGRINQEVASRATEAHLVVSGLPMRLK